MTVVANIFDRLAKSRPAEAAIEQPTKDPAQRLLEWLLTWPRGRSFSISDVLTYGPRPKKNAEEALKLAKILEKQGWIVPKSTPRKDMRHWDIVRRPIVHPKIDHRRSD